MPDSDMNHRPWEAIGYSDILGVETGSSDLRVHFANGDVLVVPLERLGLAGASAISTSPEDPTKLVADLGDQAIDVDWTRLRGASDPAFAKELRNRDTEEARRVGRRLRALREDRSIRQDVVAEQVGMTPPQLSKIERGQSDLRLSTVQALLRVMNASFADIAGPDAPEASLTDIAKAGRKAGVPREVIGALISAVPREQVSELLHRAFGWTTPDLIAGEPLPELSLALNFKAARREPAADSPLLHLAYAATVAVRKAAGVAPAGTLSSDPSQLRAMAADPAGVITLEGLIRAAWMAGIDVVPLSGSGAFSGVAWIVDDGPAIVLKESRDLLVFWLFDLAHELGHHALGHVADQAVVDIERPDLRDNDELERQANAFALQLLLPEHEHLVAEVREDSLRGQPHLRFKFAVERVAAAHGANKALLAMVAAYALEDIAEQKDRWGSATNLAKEEPSGAEVARAVVGSHLTFGELDHYETAILRAVVLG